MIQLRRSTESFEYLYTFSKDPNVAPRCPWKRVDGGHGIHVPQWCIEKGLLILAMSAYEPVRFIPPLNISKEDSKKGTKIFAETVKVVKEG